MTQIMRLIRRYPTMLYGSGLDILRSLGKNGLSLPGITEETPITYCIAITYLMEKECAGGINFVSLWNQRRIWCIILGRKHDLRMYKI